jgi:CheY-like chemotaxis protein
METPTPPAVLVVDDEPSTRYLLRDWLEASGFEVQEAEDGVAALEMLGADPERFATLILDQMMPRKDGLTVLRELRADVRYRFLPVIMQTAIDDTAHIAACLQAGARYYLVKPIDPRVLVPVTLAAVNECQRLRAAQQAAVLGLTALDMLRSGEFSFRTLAQAHALAAFLSQTFPVPERTSLGLLELFINAVEHGNLELSFDDKTRMLESGEWDAEINRRQQSAPYRDRSVRVRFECRDEEFELEVRDEGNGFDWEEYLEINPDRILLPHGRGIAIAKAMSFDELTYLGKGNQVVARVRSGNCTPREAP